MLQPWQVQVAWATARRCLPCCGRRPATRLGSRSASDLLAIRCVDVSALRSYACRRGEISKSRSLLHSSRMFRRSAPRILRRPASRAAAQAIVGCQSERSGLIYCPVACGSAAAAGRCPERRRCAMRRLRYTSAPFTLLISAFASMTMLASRQAPPFSGTAISW